MPDTCAKTGVRGYGDCLRLFRGAYCVQADISQILHQSCHVSMSVPKNVNPRVPRNVNPRQRPSWHGCLHSSLQIQGSSHTAYLHETIIVFVHMWHLVRLSVLFVLHKLGLFVTLRIPRVLQTLLKSMDMLSSNSSLGIFIACVFFAGVLSDWLSSA